MKLSSVSLLLASSLCSVTAADNACLKIADVMPEKKANGAPVCGVSDIVSKVTTELEAIQCPHTVRQEIRLLAESDKFAFAKKILRGHCRAEAGVRVPCTEWEDVVLATCTLDGVKAEIATQFAQLGANGCAHTEADELEILTGAKNANQAGKYLKAICGTAWLGVEQSRFRLDIDKTLSKSYMNQYTEGLTELNLGTGNFQGADNPNYPTEGTAVRRIGASINEFYNDGAQSSVLQKVQTLNGCENQAIMCCFGRDRQVDNDGNCSDKACDDADPGDNSNLCSIGEIDFPGQEDEGAIHCHGLAWSNDSNDPTAQLKYNNFFYVSMYDHMYKRGYVEHILANKDVAQEKVLASEGTLPPMCGCIEDMPVVVRSDCTEIVAVQDFKFNVDDNLLLNVAAEGDLRVDFKSCQGKDLDGNVAENDLASYVNVLHSDGKLDAMTRSKIFGHLVGYADPDDNDNEEACTAATTARI